MNRMNIFDSFMSNFYDWKYHLLQGIMLVLFGVLIVLLPQLLVALIASLFMAMGTGVIATAWSLRRLERYHARAGAQFFEMF